MRKIYLAFIATAFGATSFAQNLDFEAGWNAFPIGGTVATYSMPDDWFGTSQQEQPGANSTANAMRLETVNDATLAAAFAGQQVPITNDNVAGFAVASLNRTASDPFPTTVSFYYQFSPVNNDTAALVLIDVVDTMAAGATDDVLLAQGLALFSTAQASWTSTSFNLVVYQAGTPTNIDISAYASPKDFISGFPVTLPDPENGTYLLIDEIELTGNQASIKEETLNYEISAFPNPASDNFRIELPDSKARTISIMSVTGQVMKTINVTNLNMTIDLGEFENGVYLYQVKGDNGKVLTTRKLIVHK